ncbi:MAG: response regulator transcription factor [Candidatus Bipolaricaulota bacterium]
MERIRVALADDHALVRAGLRGLLADAGFDVVGEAGDGRELLRVVRATKPDVALVDVSMPLLDGLEAARRVARLSPSTRVVILTMHDDEAFAARAARVGAAGFVAKDAAADRLAEVVRCVAVGGRSLPEGLPDADEPLSPREYEVLRLIVEGKKNAEIAAVLSRSVHTVRSHRARLMKKLGVRSAAEWVAAAESVGVIAVPVSGRRGP